MVEKKNPQNDTCQTQKFQETQITSFGLTIFTTAVHGCVLTDVDCVILYLNITVFESNPKSALDLNFE